MLEQERVNVYGRKDIQIQKALITPHRTHDAATQPILTFSRNLHLYTFAGSQSTTLLVSIPAPGTGAATWLSEL